tara:strand:- start:247 stop:462 length:216 start_codon:yes stop_codon:yes gene_type:complete
MIGPILRKLLPLVLKEVASMIKPLQTYAFQPNELDRDMEEVKRRILVLEVNSHPQTEFVICETCKKKIKEK